MKKMYSAGKNEDAHGFVEGTLLKCQNIGKAKHQAGNRQRQCGKQMHQPCAQRNRGDQHWQDEQDLPDGSPGDTAASQPASADSPLLYPLFKHSFPQNATPVP